MVVNLTSPEFGDYIREKITDDQTFDDPKHYGAEYQSISDKGTSHTSIIAPNGDAISVTSSINY